MPEISKLKKIPNRPPDFKFEIYGSESCFYFDEKLEIDFEQRHYWNIKYKDINVLSQLRNGDWDEYYENQDAINGAYKKWLIKKALKEKLK